MKKRGLTFTRFASWVGVSSSPIAKAVQTYRIPAECVADGRIIDQDRAAHVFRANRRRMPGPGRPRQAKEGSNRFRQLPWIVAGDSRNKRAFRERSPKGRTRKFAGIFALRRETRNVAATIAARMKGAYRRIGLPELATRR